MTNNNNFPPQHAHVDEGTVTSNADARTKMPSVPLAGLPAVGSIASGLHATCEEYDGSASSSQGSILTPGSHADTLDSGPPNFTPAPAWLGSSWGNCGAGGYFENSCYPVDPSTHSPVMSMGNPVYSSYLPDASHFNNSFTVLPHSGHVAYPPSTLYDANADLAEKIRNLEKLCKAQSDSLAATAQATDKVATENTEWRLMHDRERKTWQKRVDELEKANVRSEKASNDLREEIAKLRKDHPVDLDWKLQSLFDTQKLQNTGISAVAGQAEAVEKLVHVSTKTTGKDIAAVEQLNEEQAQKIAELKVGLQASVGANTSLQEELEAVNAELSEAKTTAKQLQADANRAKKRAEQQTLAHEAAIEQVRNEVADLTKRIDGTVAVNDARAAFADAKLRELEDGLQNKTSTGKWDSKVLPDGSDGVSAAIKEVKDLVTTHGTRLGHLSDGLDALNAKMDSAETSTDNKIARTKIEQSQKTSIVERDVRNQDFVIRHLQRKIETTETVLSQKIDSGLGDIRKDRDLHGGKVRDLDIAIADLRQESIKQNHLKDQDASYGASTGRVNELKDGFGKALAARDAKISNLAERLDQDIAALKTSTDRRFDMQRISSTVLDRVDAKKAKKALDQLRVDCEGKISSIKSEVDTLRFEVTTIDEVMAKDLNDLHSKTERGCWEGEQQALNLSARVKDVNTRLDEALATRDTQMSSMTARSDENNAMLKTSVEQYAQLKEKLAALESQVEAAATMEDVQPFIRAARESAEDADREMAVYVEKELQKNASAIKKAEDAFNSHVAELKNHPSSPRSGLSGASERQPIVCPGVSRGPPASSRGPPATSRGPPAKDSGNSAGEAGFPEKDIDYVMTLTGVSREAAIQALEEAGGDTRRAVLRALSNSTSQQL